MHTPSVQINLCTINCQDIKYEDVEVERIRKFIAHDVASEDFESKLHMSFQENSKSQGQGIQIC